ncbi:MAG: hypothetical protein WCV90_01040 [Candidatus Woesearchaeota archaeon]|jgi:hypothetical protein
MIQKQIYQGIALSKGPGTADYSPYKVEELVNEHHGVVITAPLPDLMQEYDAAFFLNGVTIEYQFRRSVVAKAVTTLREGARRVADREALLTGRPTSPQGGSLEDVAQDILAKASPEEIGPVGTIIFSGIDEASIAKVEDMLHAYCNPQYKRG